MALSGILRRIREELSPVMASVATGKFDTAEAVAIGFELWRIIDMTTKGIEPIKALVRTAAEASGRRGQVHLRGVRQTSCMVTVPEPVAKLRKDVDLDALRQTLGARFDDLFAETVQVQPRPKFESLIQDLSPEERAAVLHAVDLTTGTSRVSFE